MQPPLLRVFSFHMNKCECIAKPEYVFMYFEKFVFKCIRLILHFVFNTYLELYNYNLYLFNCNVYLQISIQFLIWVIKMDSKFYRSSVHSDKWSKYTMIEYYHHIRCVYIYICICITVMTFTYCVLLKMKETKEIRHRKVKHVYIRNKIKVTRSE